MLDVIIPLITSVGGFLKDSSKKRRLHDEHGQKAVECILRAINETKLYIAAVTRGMPENLERKENLSRVWTDAAAALRGIDDDLAKRCRLKGIYWGDPDSWNDELAASARIKLSEVERDADSLLGWTSDGGTNTI